MTRDRILSDRRLKELLRLYIRDLGLEHGRLVMQGIHLSQVERNRVAEIEAKIQEAEADMTAEEREHCGHVLRFVQINREWRERYAADLAQLQAI